MRPAILALSALAGATAALAGATLPVGAQTGSPGPTGLLHVMGRAAVERAPDFASVQVGVASKAATAGAALADNNAASRRVVDLAKAGGLEERDIATSSVTLEPAFRSVREAGGSTSVPDGYTAHNAVTLRVRDLGRTGDLLRRLVDSGANRLDSIAFGLNDPGKALEDAQAEAISDAVRRAGRIAGAAGVSLGPIERIEAPPRQESARPSPPPFPAALAAAPRRGGTAVPIEAGTVEVSAEVDVTFRLVQP